jgi:hypothetical protein
MAMAERRAREKYCPFLVAASDGIGVRQYSFPGPVSERGRGHFIIHSLGRKHGTAASKQGAEALAKPDEKMGREAMGIFSWIVMGLVVGVCSNSGHANPEKVKSLIDKHRLDLLDKNSLPGR